MTLILVNCLAFFAVFLAVFAVSALLVDLRSDEKKQRRKQEEAETRERQRKRARSGTQPQTHEFSAIVAEAYAEQESQMSWNQKLNLWIDQAGITVSLERLIVYTAYSCLGGALLGGAVGWALTDLAGAAVFAVLGAIGGAVLPAVYVHLKRKKRIDTLRNQLPDAFELMSRVMRSGQTISQAMQAVADEFQPPLALEFLYVSEQLKMGLSTDTAFREMGQRTGLLEMRIFTLAVVVHRQTGGNLAELFDKLAHVVRERFRINGMITSLTAQGRFQAGILLSLPPFMFCLLMILHREYEMILLGYPLLILLALGMMGLGALWINKVVNFDY